MTLASQRVAAMIILAARDARRRGNGVPLPEARGGLARRIVRAPILRVLQNRRVNAGLYRTIGRRVGGGQFVATGYEHVVYRSGSGVVKVVVATFGMGHDEAAAYVRTVVDRERRCRRYLGGWWVDTRYELVPISAIVRRYAVVAHQRHVTGTDLADLRDSAIDGALHREIAGFVRAVQAMPTLVGLVPDLVGAGNVVIEDDAGRPRLRVIDTLSLEIEELRTVHPDDERSMGERNDAVLSSLERRLRRVS
ncbi:MAG: hypothetical protein AB7L13_20860 [Acidimicrobiia bacterium]